MKRTNRKPSPAPTLAATAGLCLAAAVAPFSSIPLAPGFDLPWDALPRFAALCVLGLAPGMAAAVAAALSTWWLSGSWTACMLPLVEVLAVGLLAARWKTGPLTAACAFWALAYPLPAAAGKMFPLLASWDPAHAISSCVGALACAAAAEPLSWLLGDKRPPLRNLMAAPVVAMALGVSLAAVAIHGHLAHREVSRRLEARARSAAEQAAAEVAAWLDRRVRALAPAARKASMSRGKPDAAMASILEGLVAALPGIKAVVVIDAGGAIAAAHPARDALGAAMKGRPAMNAGAWRALKSASAPLVSDLEFSTASFSPSVEVATPLRDRRGRLLGAVVATLDLGALERLLGRTSGDDVSLTLLDWFGAVAASSRREVRPMLPFEPAPGAVRRRARVRGTPWTLVAEADPARATAAASGGTVAIMTFLAPSALLAFLAVVLVSAVVARPLARLAEETRRLPETMTRGGRQVALPRPLSREAGILSDTLRQAAERLRDLWVELDEMRNTLEFRVRARTRELEDANRELERLAATDRLTGLWNRGRFDEFLEREVARCRRYDRLLSLVMIDLDHFKGVNDTHGHLKGDEVLVAAARLQMESSRSSDLPARYGGEEMALVMPETELRDAMVVAERFRRAMKGLRFRGAGGMEFSVSCSIGVAQFDPGTDPDAESLAKRADEALYRAKEGGRDRVETHPPSPKGRSWLRIVAADGGPDAAD